MPFSNIEKLPKTGKILCVDAGKKTLGIAISDKLRKIATIYPTIRRTKWKNDKEKIAHYIEDNHIEVFIVGFPVNTDGTKGPSADMAESFADTLESEFGLPVMLADESYSTQKAEMTMMAIGTNRKKAKKDKDLDSVAASFILQNILDELQ